MLHGIQPLTRKIMRISQASLLFFGLLLLSGCGFRQFMFNQPKQKALTGTTVFADNRVARPLVPGTVAVGHSRVDEHFYTGKVAGKLVDTFPFTVTTEVLLRGQERYNIYCAPCHDRKGRSVGMVAKRGFSPPANFHAERLLSQPAGYFFDVMTNGFRNMPSYGLRIPPKDRWAIVAYIRALQLSENATLNDVPAAERANLQGTPK